MEPDQKIRKDEITFVAKSKRDMAKMWRYLILLISVLKQQAGSEATGEDSNRILNDESWVFPTFC